MGEIYNKETNIFNFGNIVIHPNLTYDELLSKYSKYILFTEKFNNKTSFTSIKTFKLKNNYYYISLFFNSLNIISGMTIEIDSKKIVIPKKWENYNRDEEERKKIIHDKWIIDEDIVSNEIIEVHSIINQPHIYQANISIKYKNREDKDENDDNKCSFISKLRNILYSVIH